MNICSRCKLITLGARGFSCAVFVPVMSPAQKNLLWLFLWLHHSCKQSEVFRSAMHEKKPTIPDKKVGTASKFSPPPTFNVGTRVIFYLFVGKNAIFSNIDEGGWGIHDPTQVSQLLLAGIVDGTQGIRLCESQFF